MASYDAHAKANYARKAEQEAFVAAHAPYFTRKNQESGSQTTLFQADIRHAADGRVCYAEEDAANENGVRYSIGSSD